jgi:hypothetical protein
MIAGTMLDAGLTLPSHPGYEAIFCILSVISCSPSAVIILTELRVVCEIGTCVLYLPETPFLYLTKNQVN